MENAVDLMRRRKSVRTYDGRALTGEDVSRLNAFMENVENPYGIRVDFKMLDAAEHGLNSPVITGTSTYIAGKVCRSDHGEAVFGCSFEMLSLYALSLGIGTVCLGGTMNRDAFERAMELSDTEIMPCVTPVGYPAARMSVREALMRKGVRADRRAHFETLFFDGAFAEPLTGERAGRLKTPLEMVRLAPSAVNRQPWRVVLKDSAAHFYLKRAKGFDGGMFNL